MARKRSRIVCMPKPRRKSSNSKSLSATQISTVEVDQTVQGQSEAERENISAELAPSEEQSNETEQSKNASEEVLSPNISNSKLKRSKRRSASIVYRPQSRRNRSARSQSSVSSETSNSVQGRRKIGRNKSPEEIKFESSSNSGEKKDKNWTKERTQNVKDFNSGKSRKRQSSRNSGGAYDPQTSSEETATVLPVDTKEGKVKQTKRKSTKLVCKPKSSSKESKQKKQKLSDNSTTEKEENSLNMKPKRQRNKNVVDKKSNISGDSNKSMENSTSRGQKKNSSVGRKPPAKKSKQALQENEVSVSGQDITERAKVKESVTNQRKTRQKTQREEIPERIQDMSVTRKAYAKWKPLSSSTKDHVKEIVDSSIMHVMNMIGSKGSTKEDVQKHLDTLKQRIFTRLHSTKGPTHLGDYSKMEKQLEVLEASILLNNSQMEALEKELVVQKRLLEDEQEQLQTLTSDVNQNEGKDFHIDRTKLHHLLQNEPVNTLNLPQLPKESFERPFPKISSEIKEISTKLSQTVKNMMESAETLKVPQWLEYLSQISDNLPGHSN